MGYAVDVQRSNFAEEVLQASYFQPVLVDFYATWCGPCQLLKPLLEKLLQEYDFILAKIDIDQNPELAQQFAVEGVPDVRIAVRGEMVPGFVGVLKEEQIRDLLARLNLKSELEVQLEEVKIALAEKNYPRAKEIFDQLLAKYPDNPQVVIEAAYFLFKLQRFAEAEKIAQTIGKQYKEQYPKAQYLQTLIQAQRQLRDLGEGELGEMFKQAVELMIVEDYEPALPLLLEIIKKNRQYQQDSPRKLMVALFHWLGLEHPLSQQYQRELGAILY
jgi:putative thioredoxin